MIFMKHQQGQLAFSPSLSGITLLDQEQQDNGKNTIICTELMVGLHLNTVQVNRADSEWQGAIPINASVCLRQIGLGHIPYVNSQ